METKICRSCGEEMKIGKFRVHKSGFVLNQCKDCEKAATKSRRLSSLSKTAKTVVSEFLKVTTKSGKVIEDRKSVV